MHALERLGPIDTAGGCLDDKDIDLEAVGQE
jgi:hypothetical protein